MAAVRRFLPCLLFPAIASCLWSGLCLCLPGAAQEAVGDPAPRLRPALAPDSVPAAGSAPEINAGPPAELRPALEGGGDLAGGPRPTPETPAGKTKRLEASVTEQAREKAEKNVRFEIEITRPLDPATVKVGDEVAGKLTADLVVDGVKIASAGDAVHGKVSKLVQGRRTVKAYVPGKHWFNAQGRLSLEFFEIVTSDKKEVRIDGRLCPNSEVLKATPSKVRLVVNKDGELTAKYGVFKYMAMDGLVAGAVLATGPVGMIVAPVVTGTIGAVRPSYAEGRPVDPSEKQSPAKNFLLGAGRGIPGGSLVFGLSTKGMNVGLNVGDRLEVSLKEGAPLSAVDL